MSYLALKYVHITCAVLSIAFFALRGAWALRDDARLQHTLVRILPHVIDTILLASAIGLVTRTAQYPFVEAWLTVKVFALIAYIVLGSLAIHRAPSRLIQRLSYGSALATAGFIFSIAWTRSPLGIFSLLTA